MTRSITVTLLTVLALLAGCASSPTATDSAQSSWGQRSLRLAQLQNWQAEGKLALRNAGQAESANLLWRQRGKHSELQLSGPLGMAATRITSDGKTLDIQRGNEHQQMDISSPHAIQLNTGWDLPLAALPYWLRGIPQPGAAPDELQIEHELLRSLQQDGWQVEFQGYATFGTYTLPTRLQVKRGATSARLVIRHWLTGDEL